MQKRDTIKSMIKRTRMRNLIKGVKAGKRTTGRKGREVGGKEGGKMRGEEERNGNRKKETNYGETAVETKKKKRKIWRF